MHRERVHLVARRVTERLARARRGRLVRLAPVPRVAPVVAPGVPYRVAAMSLVMGHDAMIAHLNRAVRHVPLASARVAALAARVALAAATARRDAHRDVVTIDTRPVHADPAPVERDVPCGPWIPRSRLASEPVHTPAGRAGVVSRVRAR